MDSYSILRFVAKKEKNLLLKQATPGKKIENEIFFAGLSQTVETSLIEVARKCSKKKLL